MNYILENNGNTKIKDIKYKFLKSTALYCVVSHLLGVGDRHLDNIMVHKSGNLFHIDFEYILGEDPKITSQTMRLTHDMVETIGGKTSTNYLLFKHRCTQIFNCLRKHMNIFITMLSLLETKKLTEDKIIDAIHLRFEPGDKYLSTDTYITTIIDNSHDTIEDGIFDLIYRYAKIFK